MGLFKKIINRQSIAGLISISFGIMAVFSIYLHTHELDPSTADADCAPCHWSQTPVSLDLDVPDFAIAPSVTALPTLSERAPFQRFIAPYLGRSPPVFS